jgi:hypothetical protein
MRDSLLHAALFEDSDDSHTVPLRANLALLGLKPRYVAQQWLVNIPCTILEIIKYGKTVGGIVQVVKLVKWEEHGCLQAGAHIPRQVNLHV